ncbi:hypothetical protein QYF61_027832 [Mycteria americana]|uniref:Protocadherin gamma-C3 n=1 Tax=Mycteria americana TaxID=33587 RepID=A0AAN7MWL9_MYCAM|nr:hypothetical protein QYF61_027832 [Mycteria americana]
MERESFVASIAKDLGVSPSQLTARKARVVCEGNEQLFRLNQNTRVLTAKELLDREEICPQSDTCMLFFNIFFENPLQLIQGEVEVRDVNDNSPVFPEKDMVLEILETASPGSHFSLESAQDKDVGSNGLLNYSLRSNSHFSLALGTVKGGAKYAELVLEWQLDCEEQRELNLLLTATDGGSPSRSGTAQVRIVVLDANDNIPVFGQEVYKVCLAENSPLEHLVARVTAADPNEVSNRKVRYTFTQTSKRSQQLFKLNSATGEIRVAGNLDFKEVENHEMVVRATDGGGLSAHCKVQVEILDVNDNAPKIALTSFIACIPKDAPPRTVVALFSVRDRDSGDNGRTECAIDGDLPFSLTPTFDNYYELRTNAALDRERTAEYNITITATDWGTMRLSSRESIFVQISDVNDNPPEFTQEIYTMSVTENNSPMLWLGSVNATDADVGKNAHVNYALVQQEGKKQPDVLVNTENGDIYILRPLDYEEVRAFEVAVRATDGSSPPLSAQAVLRMVVWDENDNVPLVLHPPPDSSAAAGELVPCWAWAGYLVAKVVAVDADTGQNAWLSYELAKSTEPGLFRVGLHSGEVRRAWAVVEHDAPRQRLIVLVRDGRQPPRSATATLSIVLVDGFSDAHLQVSKESPTIEPDRPLTLYLIVCLACMSALFLATVVAAVVVKMQRTRWSEAETLPTFLKAAMESNAGSLPRSYVHDVCFASGTVNSEFCFLRPVFPCFPAGLPPGPGEQWSSVCLQEAASLGEGGNWAAQGRAPLSKDMGPRPVEAACTANRGMELNVNSDQNPWLTHHEELSALQARLVPEEEKQYLRLNQHTGGFLVREQMDGEELCGKSEPCLVRFVVLLESPLQSFRAEVSLTNINDHAPVFLNKETVLKIPETAMPEARFLLESMQDSDVGNNSLQHYSISSNDYFHIYTRRRSDGRRYAELVLDQALDRQQQAEVAFTVMAVDGGFPPHSGTALIRVVVLDRNDNIPVFTRSLYKVRVLENSSQDTLVVVVSASDLDSGPNGEIAIVQNSEENLQTFKINPEAGYIQLKKQVDYEETKTYEVDIQATDGGGLSVHCKVRGRWRT